MIIIKAVDISNFRSVVRMEKNIRPNHLNIIVGQNDIGKSNFLKALNLFFNGETDLDTVFRFVDDFSHYAITAKKKAEEVTIKITFNSSERYKTSEDLVWTKVWRKTGLHKDTVLTVSGKAPSNRSGALQWVKKIKYKYVPAVRGQEYFNHLMGDLHDALSEMNPAAFNIASGNFIDGLKAQVAILVNDIASKLGYSSEIGMPSDFKLLFSTLDFGLTTDGRVVSLNKRGDGIKAQHIPLILKFIASHYKSISGKAIITPDTIWGFEEPENNMEMGNAFKLSKIFLEYSSDLQIFINTHSPAFYSLAKDNQSTTHLYLVKSDTGNKSTKLLEIAVEDISKLDEEVGILPVITEYVKKEVELRQIAELKAQELENLKSKTKFLILSEDNDLRYCKAIFQMQGFSDDETEYVPYDSRANLSAAIQSCRLKISDKPELKHVIFHRDSDIYDDDEYDFESVNRKIAKLNADFKVKYHLFKTAGYDLESYFVDAEHLHAIYPELSTEELESMIEEATKEVEETSLDKLLVRLHIYESEYEKRGEKQIFSHTKYIKKIKQAYYDNPKRYRYGKSVLGVLIGKMQKKLGKNPNLLKHSDKIQIQQLQEISGISNPKKAERGGKALAATAVAVAEENAIAISHGVEETKLDSQMNSEVKQIS